MPVHWLLEGVLIVISVALGFWVTQLQEARSDRRLAARVLDGVLAEVEHNRAVLEPFVPMHRAWANALTNVDTSIARRSGWDVYVATRPAYPAGAQAAFPFLRRSAWDVALSGGALRLIDYDVAATLSDIYQLQELVGANVGRLVNAGFGAATTFDPASQAPSVRLIWLTLEDIAGAEAALLDLYRQHLPTIRAAADAQR